jgi:phosphate transport system substrate-binding protein
MHRLVAAATLLGALLLTACADSAEGKTPVAGAIRMDGSSTVYPISQAVAEEFSRVYSGAEISLGLSGTGGGFEKFCNGETTINNASRAIKQEEAQRCRENDVPYTELTVAADGLSIVVNPDNAWVDCLTVAQLQQIWRPDDPARRWSDVDPSWPDKQINLYGPGTDSGTFDYFTAAINGEEGSSRSDYNASEDDNVLVQGVGGDRYGLAYLGYAYYSENTELLKAVGVNNGAGCVTPTAETVRSGAYAPLSRPLYVYVANDALSAPGRDGKPNAVATFARYYLTDGVEVIPFVGYITYDDSVYQEQREKLDAVLRDQGSGAGACASHPRYLNTALASA